MRSNDGSDSKRCAAVARASSAEKSDMVHTVTPRAAKTSRARSYWAWINSVSSGSRASSISTSSKATATWVSDSSRSNARVVLNSVRTAPTSPPSERWERGAPKKQRNSSKLPSIR